MFQQLLISEKIAGINMLSFDGRADSAVFYGKDPKLLKMGKRFISLLLGTGKEMLFNIM